MDRLDVKNIVGNSATWNLILGGSGSPIGPRERLAAHSPLFRFPLEPAGEMSSIAGPVLWLCFFLQAHERLRERA